LATAGQELIGKDIINPMLVDSDLLPFHVGHGLCPIHLLPLEPILLVPLLLLAIFLLDQLELLIND